MRGAQGQQSAGPPFRSAGCGAPGRVTSIAATPGRRHRFSHHSRPRIRIRGGSRMINRACSTDTPKPSREGRQTQTNLLHCCRSTNTGPTTPSFPSTRRCVHDKRDFCVLFEQRARSPHHGKFGQCRECLLMVHSFQEAGREQRASYPPSELREGRILSLSASYPLRRASSDLAGGLSGFPTQF